MTPSTKRPQRRCSDATVSGWQKRLHTAFTVAVLVLATTVVATTAGAAERKIVLRTDYRFNGWIAPFSLAVQRGYYRDVGLDVEIAQGQGSGTTLQTVGSGADDIGLCDAAVALLGISAQDIPVILVSVYLQSNVVGLIYGPKSGFTGDLKSLRGRPVISSVGAADLTLLKPALATAGMTSDDVDLRLVDFNARIPMFLQTPEALLTGFAAGDFLRARLKGADVTYKPYSDYGVIAYSTGMIVRRQTAEKDPDLVRKLVAASAKGWRDAAADPETAVQSGLKLFPDLDAQQVRESLKIVLASQLHTPATEGHPIGWSAASDWQKMIDTMTKYAGMKPKPADYYYTNRFIAEP